MKWRYIKSRSIFRVNNYLMKKIGLFLFMGCACIAIAQPAAKDKEFVLEAAEGGLMEVMLGRYAVARATTPEVKLHAQHMIDDHTKGNNELKDLAAKKNIALPALLSKKEQKQYDKLIKTKGNEFDKEYTEFMISDHKKDIELFKKEAKEGTDEEIKKWAASKVSVLEGHLAMWQEAEKAIKK